MNSLRWSYLRCGVERSLASMQSDLEKTNVRSRGIAFEDLKACPQASVLHVHAVALAYAGKESDKHGNVSCRALGSSKSWHRESLYSPFADFAGMEFVSRKEQSADERDGDSNVPLSPAPSKTLRLPPWIQPLPTPPADICCGFFDDVGTDCRRRPPDWQTDPLQYLIGANPGRLSAFLYTSHGCYPCSWLTSL